jgi:hypothetical protein
VKMVIYKVSRSAWRNLWILDDIQSVPDRKCMLLRFKKKYINVNIILLVLSKQVFKNCWQKCTKWAVLLFKRLSTRLCSTRVSRISVSFIFSHCKGNENKSFFFCHNGAYYFWLLSTTISTAIPYKQSRNCMHSQFIKHNKWYIKRVL